MCEYQIIVGLIQISHIDLPLTKLLYAFCNQYLNNKKAKIDSTNHSDPTYNAPRTLAKY